MAEGPKWLGAQNGWASKIGAWRRVQNGWAGEISKLLVSGVAFEMAGRAKFVAGKFWNFGILAGRAIWLGERGWSREFSNFLDSRFMLDSRVLPRAKKLKNSNLAGRARKDA